MRVIGFCVDAALRGLPPGRISDDVADLGGLLYCPLTGRWAGISPLRGPGRAAQATATGCGRGRSGPGSRASSTRSATRSSTPRPSEPTCHRAGSPWAQRLVGEPVTRPLGGHGGGAGRARTTGDPRRGRQTIVPARAARPTRSARAPTSTGPRVARRWRRRPTPPSRRTPRTPPATSRPPTSDEEPPTQAGHADLRRRQRRGHLARAPTTSRHRRPRRSRTRPSGRSSPPIPRTASRPGAAGPASATPGRQGSGPGTTHRRRCRHRQRRPPRVRGPDDEEASPAAPGSGWPP